MAYTELNEGATSFAAANWADATGFANGAELRITQPFGPVTGASLDQSAADIAALDITPSARGTIGGDGAELKVEADTPAGAFVRNHGAVSLYLEASGVAIDNFDFGPQSTNVLVGGAFGVITGSGGRLTIGASATATTVYITGGSGTIDFNATAITSATITGGRWFVRRGVTTLNIGGSAVVTDDRALGGTTATVNVYGGTYRPVRGNVANVYGYGGVIDCRAAAAPVDLGSSVLQLTGASLLRSELVDVTNLSRPGAMRAAEYPGGAIPL